MKYGDDVPQNQLATHSGLILCRYRGPDQKCPRLLLARRLAGVLAVCLLTGCATPTDKLLSLAEQRGLNVSKVSTGTFDLLAIDNMSSSKGRVGTSDKVLRVYLEGDGSPWQHRVIVLPDPTPRYPLVLRLMSIDHNPSVYLGRPCYNGSYGEPECNSTLWTSGRYSNAVVQSMASGVRAMMRRFDATELWLIGHSGGGALAMLLAGELPQVTKVVTVAGNLDADAWTDFHGYTRLFSSINPATQPQLRDTVSQWHLLGLQDQVIPAQLIKPFVMQQANARGFEFPRFDHGCCWERAWLRVLGALKSGRQELMPGAQFKFPVVEKELLDDQ